MTRNELIEKVEAVIDEGIKSYRMLDVVAKDVLSTILAALQEPTGGMIDANLSNSSRTDIIEDWRAMLAASALGERSDRAEIISADGAIWDETATGTRNFKRREQSE